MRRCGWGRADGVHGGSRVPRRWPCPPPPILSPPSLGASYIVMRCRGLRIVRIHMHVRLCTLQYHQYSTGVLCKYSDSTLQQYVIYSTTRSGMLHGTARRRKKRDNARTTLLVRPLCDNCAGQAIAHQSKPMTFEEHPATVCVRVWKRTTTRNVQQ